MKKKSVFLTVFIFFTNLLFAESPGTINDNSVRLRSLPKIENSRILVLMEKGLVVTVFEVTEEKYSIEGEAYPWYRVTCERGKDHFSGWVWGKFVSVRNIQDVKIAPTRELILTLYANYLFIEYLGINPDQTLTTTDLTRYVFLEKGQVRNDRFFMDYDWQRFRISIGEAWFDSRLNGTGWVCTSIKITKMEKINSHPIYIGQNEIELVSIFGEPVILENRLIYWVRYMDFAAGGYWSFEITVTNHNVTEISLQANYDP